jgi:polysaccharide pyruvyl transferase WcaK-like protein
MIYKYQPSESKNTVVNIDPFPIVQNYKIDVSAYDLIVLGGGSLINLSYWINICKEGISNKIPVVSWGTGFDGLYRKEDYDTVKMPNHQIDYFRTIYEKFEFLSVRGPFTTKMLNNIGLKKEIHEIGDPALAYASEVFKDHLGVVKQHKHILINWGTSHNNIFGGNELLVEEELVIAIHALITQGYTITIYPIWTEDINAVKRLGTKVNDSRCQVQEVVYEAKTLQKIIHNSYLSINLKLHANILSAAANRPFISLAYRGKCFDFSKSVNCLDYTIATDAVTSEKILDMVRDIERNYDEIMDEFQLAKAKYHPKLIDSILQISHLLN